MSLEEHLCTLSLFARAETGPEGVHALLAGSAAPDRRPFVYRNSGMLACIDALRSNYRRLRATMGEEEFTGLARAYLTHHSPTARTLVGFGQALPEFILETEQGLRSPWWSDLARLDRAWLQAHIAADDQAMTPADVAGIAGADDALPTLRLELRASVRIVRTGWAVFDTWEQVLATPACDGPMHREAQSVLVWRPAMEVETRFLAPAEAAFLGACASGVTLGEAFLAARSADETLNVSEIFAASLLADVFAVEVVGGTE